MNGTTMQVPASEVRWHDDDTEGDFLPGLGNGYVVAVEEGNGYVSYPSTGYGMSAAMPEDTIIITFHDAEGNENFILCASDMPVTVERN